MPRPNFKRSIALAPVLAPMPIQPIWILEWVDNLMLNVDLVEYLGKRGVIDPEYYRIGYTGDDKRLSKAWMRDKIVIPHYHENKLTAIKLRNNPITTGGGYITLSDENDPLIGKSSYALPYNIDAVQKSKVVGIIETEIDAAAFSMLLGSPIAAIPAGSVKTPDGKWICHSFKDYFTDYFLHCERLVVFCDNDESGRAFARAIQSKIGIAVPCFPPPNVKDFGELYQLDKDNCLRIMMNALYSD